MSMAANSELILDSLTSTWLLLLLSSAIYNISCVYIVDILVFTIWMSYCSTALRRVRSSW